MMDLQDVDQNEMALLGSTLFRPDVLDRLTGVSGSNFANRSMGRIFDLTRDLHEKGSAIDVNILMSEVRKSRIDITSAELAEVFQSVPNALHAPYYAKNVLDAYRRRKLLGMSDAIRARARDAAYPMNEILADIETIIETLDTSEENYSIPASDAAAECYERLFRKKEAESLGVPTGMADVDLEMGGLMPGEMTVLAARPGCGKTSLALQIAEHSASQKRNTMFVSLEMGENELVQRSISARTGTSSRDLRTGHVPESNTDGVKKSLREIAALDLTFFVPPKATLRQIRAAARVERSRNGLELLVIDYLGLIRPVGKTQGKYEDVTLISNEIKAMARELKVPVLVLCQLNREAEGKTPMLSHLRDSGAIEQDADAVWFLEPKDWLESQRTGFNLIVAKNRHGKVLKTELMFEGARTRFVSTNYNSEFAEFA